MNNFANMQNKLFMESLAGNKGNKEHLTYKGIWYSTPEKGSLKYDNLTDVLTGNAPKAPHNKTKRTVPKKVIPLNSDLFLVDKDPVTIYKPSLPMLKEVKALEPYVKNIGDRGLGTTKRYYKLISTTTQNVTKKRSSTSTGALQDSEKRVGHFKKQAKTHTSTTVDNGSTVTTVPRQLSSTTSEDLNSNSRTSSNYLIDTPSECLSKGDLLIGIPTVSGSRVIARPMTGTPMRTKNMWMRLEDGFLL